METIREDFDKILIFMGIPFDEIRNEASFAEDYNFTESKFICLALYMGIFFKINVKESEYAEIGTVDGAVKFIKKKIESRLYK